MTGLTNGASYVFRVSAVNVIGAGVASAVSAAVVPFTVAAAPTSLTATAGFRQATLSWAAPASDGGRAISDYKVEYRPTSAAIWQTFTRAASTATNATVTGLTNGTSYVFRVSAVNAAGPGIASDVSAEVVPAVQLPAVPYALIGRSGNLAAVLNWSAPAFDGGGAVSDYTVQYSSDGSSWTTFPHAASAATTATVTGLTAGTSYQFRVAAVNSAGQGGFTAASAAVFVTTVPGVPKNLVGVPGGPQAALSWSAPDTNGFSAISDYTIEYRPTTASVWQTFAHTPSTATTATVTGLTIGTGYVFRVSAVNGSGVGAASAVSAELVPIVIGPGMPRYLIGTPGDRQVNLSWLAPLSDGGSAITSYEVQFSSNGGSTWSTFGRTAATALLVTGLNNDAAYVFRVAATNVLGIGPATDASAAVTPAFGAFPYVTDISLAGPVSPGATSVTWNVSFSKPVTGVDATDFQLVRTWARITKDAPTSLVTGWFKEYDWSSGADVWPRLSVVGSGSSYTVTYTPREGQGPLGPVGLNLVDNDTIRDLGSRPLLNRGQPSFSFPPRDVAMPGYKPLITPGGERYDVCEPQVSADFNGDGRPDLAGTPQLKYSSGEYLNVTVYLGNGDGTVRPVVTTVGGSDPGVITGVGDINTDGRPDIVLSWPDKGRPAAFAVLYGVGDGSFQKQPSLDYDAIALADFTHDGISDVLAWNPANKMLSVLVNSGSGSFQVQQTSIDRSSVSDVSVSDINRDGWPDVVLGHPVDGTIGVLLNNQAGGFKDQQTIAAGVKMNLVQTSDLNNDGWPDVVVGDSVTANTLRVFLGSSGGLQPASMQLLPDLRGYDGIKIADINEDGLPDLVRGKNVYAGNGDGTFGIVDVFRENWQSVPIADMNNDGRPDMVGVREVYSDQFRQLMPSYEGIRINETRGDYTGEVVRVKSGKPEGLVGTVGDGQISLSWSAPATAEGSVITDYVIQFSTNGGATWSSISHPASAATSYTVKLENGRAYQFRVAAVVPNSVFDWDLHNVAFSSPSAMLTPFTTPGYCGQPGIPSVSPGCATITWSAPYRYLYKNEGDGGSPITGFAIRYSSDGGTSWTSYGRVGIGTPQATITGLVDGRTYLFQVAAENAAGTGTFSESGQVTLRTPLATAAPTVAARYYSPRDVIEVSWTGPASGFSGLQGYEVQYSSDGTTWKAIPTTAVDNTYFGPYGGGSGSMQISKSRFQSGTYKFRVAAVNGFGRGDWSAPSNWFKVS